MRIPKAPRGSPMLLGHLLILVTSLIVSQILAIEASKPRSTKMFSASEKQQNLKTSQQEAAPAADHKQQDALMAAASSPMSSVKQPAADKKQGDAAQSPIDSLNQEEYVQIKPEEMSASDQGKEIDAVIAAAVTGQQQMPSGIPSNDASAPAEHKSAVDEELNAHLAQDVIAPLESSYRPAQVPASQAAPRAAYGMQAPARGGPFGPRPGYPMQPAPRPTPYKPAAQAAPAPYRGPRMPPSYITLKGKLTGINSLINQYPHPAPGYPHQGPRHLPRGAAAGYAAFRDFVRAHASKYKNLNTGAPNHPAPAAAALYDAPKAVTGNAYNAGSGSGGDYAPTPKPAYGGAPKENSYEKLGSGQKSKVSMTQAYIPHPAPSGGEGSYGANQGSAPYTNPMLAKLYGNHAPQGVGKPEYSKDYGMVIHYPQATVYTEPMTIEQLHKLTGNGVSQILEQLQHNIASGHRDEASMLRGNRQHHIGDGVTIHAKEFYAPGKGGNYVPTTAAVISTGGKSNYDQPESSYGSESQEGPDYPMGDPSAAYSGPAVIKGAHELGAGYERVKQAVAVGQHEKYNNGNNQHGNRPKQTGYESNDNKHGNGEPLTSITHLIGSELNSLYKANAQLNKHLEPEIQAGIQAYKNSGAYGKTAPLRYRDLTPQRAPAGLQYHGPSGPQRRPQKGFQQPRPHGHRAPRGREGPNRYNNHPYPRPPHYRQPQSYQSGYRQQHPRHHPPMSGYGNRPNQAANYMQQQAYKSAEAALNNQMMQVLQDFNAGDEQYNGKSTPNRPINQGYPHKIMQKYQPQQQPQQGYGQSGAGYHSQISDQALEIPQSPNDQIGEIADLIESLKGTLEQHRPEGPSYGGDSGSYGASKQSEGSKMEDVRYLASALGQQPTYAIQVPVANESGAHDKKPADSYGQQQGGYQQQAQQQPQQQQQQYQGAAENQQQAGNGYGQQQQQQAYGAQQQPQQAQPAEAYGQQQQQGSGYGAQGSSYGSEYQQQREAGPQQDYQAQPQQQYQQQQQDSYPSGGVPLQHVQSLTGPTPIVAPTAVPSSGSNYNSEPAAASPGAYPAAQQAAAPAAQPATNGYSPADQSTVINHLVPAQAAAPAAPVSSNYEQASSSSSGSSHDQSQQQPASAIAISAPTDSHYQQAQSLSSFVDSLPSDYQDLLRQPALIDGHSSAPHLAALAQEGQISGNYASNGASASASSGYDSASSVSNPSYSVAAAASTTSQTYQQPDKTSSSAQTQAQSQQTKSSAQQSQQTSSQSQSQSSASASNSQKYGSTKE